MLLLWFLVRIPSVQNRLLPIVTSEISKALCTEVTADKIDLEFFTNLSLQNALISDNNKDTLFFAKELDLDISLFSFFNKTLHVDNIFVSGGTLKFEEKDGVSNYQHIVDHLNKPKDEDSNDSAPWNLDLEGLNLENVTIFQKGNNTDLKIVIPNLNADITDFDASFQTLHLAYADTKGVEIYYIENQKGTTDEGPTEFPSLPISIQIDKLEFKNGRVNYDRDYVERKTTKLDGNHLAFSNLNVTSQDFRWGKSISGDITSIAFEEQSGLILQDMSTVFYLDPQSLGLQDLNLATENSFLILDLETRFKDFNQLINDFTEVEMELDVNDLSLKTSDIKKVIDIKTISAINLSKVDEITYSGKISSKDGKYFAKNSKLRVDNNLNANGSLLFNTKNQNYTAELSYLRTTDRSLKILFPFIKFPSDLQDLGDIKGSGTVYGGPDNINFENLNLLLNEESKIEGSGSIADFNNPKGPYLDLRLSKLEASLSNVFKKGGAIPDQVFELGQIQFEGDYKGNLYDLDIDGKIISDLGKSDLDMKINFNQDYSDASYNGTFNLEGVDIGKLLSDKKFGITTGTGTISGSGLNIENLNANMDMKINSVYYDGETYTGISVDGSYHDDLFDGKLVSKDEKLALDFEGKAALNGAETKVDFTTQIDRLDLRQFGMGDSILWISGLLSGDLQGNTIDNVIGNGKIKNLKLGTLNGEYHSDSVVTFTSELKPNGIKEYKLTSPFLDGNIQGNIQLTQLPNILEAYIKNYIPIESGYESDVTTDSISYDHQSFIVDLKTKDINPLLEIINGKDIKVKSAKLGGLFSTDDSKIDLKGSMDSLFYAGYTITKTNYFFDGRKDFINGNILLSDIYDDDNIVINEAIVTTSLNNKNADINLELFDKDGNENLYLGGNLTRTNEYIFNFHDSLRINQDTWIFAEENEISYGEDGLYMQMVEVTKDDQKVTLYTDENENGQAIEVIFNNFIISEVSKIIGQQNDYFEGAINGTALINSVWDKPFITADGSINDILISENNIGTLTIQANQNVEANTVKSIIQLEGQENDALLNIDYNIVTQGIKGVLDMKNLSMSAVDPFLTQVIRDSKGFVNGKVTIGGNLDAPALSGKVFLKGVETTPLFTNSKFRILDNSIDISNRSFQFGEMTLIDEEDNEATLSGQITHNKLSDVRLDLKLETDKFQFMNTTEVDNELFFGNIKVKANVTVTGPLDDVQIDGSATAIDLSNLTLSPFSVDQFSYDTDYIIFADPRSITIDSLKSKSLGIQNTFPFDVDIKLTVNENSRFEMIMDPETGDKIEAFGNADFVFRLTKAGDILLFGDYNVTNGNYYFSYTPVIKKTFEIQKGSSVTFNGDPLLATMDVSAIYVANTAVYDLLKLETASLREAQISEAQRKRDMNVVLNLSKSIISPEIKMDITNQEEDISSISKELTNKLQQLRNYPDELNNQVFGLLVFDNFILATDSDIDLAQTGTDIAIQSISGLVNKQLNKLADGLIPGFDIDFGVNSYSSSYLAGGKGGLITELGAKASTNLFNDRLKVTAGTNVNLESTTQNSVFNTLVGDFILEYKLNSKGNYRVKAFRKSSYDRILDENSAKNGASIYVRKEFGKVKKKN